MYFKTKTDALLLSDLKSLVSREREILSEILHHLREVENRKLHLELGHPSLFEFATLELGYSNAAAQRRILAMRLLKAVPSMEEKIVNGELSLSVAAQVQGFFRHEERILRSTPRPAKEKLEIVTALLGASSRQCERQLAELSPDFLLPREKQKALPGKKTLIQFTADEALFSKLERLKGLLVHGNFEGHYSKLFDQLADIALQKLQPKAPKLKSPINETRRKHIPISRVANDLKSKALPTSEVKISETLPQVEKIKSRFIALGTKREVWKRDGGRCTYKGSGPSKNGPLRRCSSTRALQYDHIHPFAWGGTNTAENITLRCPAHNQLRAQKMGMTMPIKRDRVERKSNAA
jgi:5-methylcytosine-specific restriction endonuclease McrA